MRLVINNQDFSSKLNKFSLKCSKCGSYDITFDIDWAAYPSCAWCSIITICEGCKNEEEIYSAF